ncbi:MAG: hypothetical protein H7Y11_09305 [Armatimonadetes bacterium]|nr:hypothetical protein [Anaerolineae bacterium]
MSTVTKFTPATRISLFDLLRDNLKVQLPTARFTKTTMVHISHTLEDIVLNERLPALMFTGFQASHYWAQEANHYQALAEVAGQVYSFAGHSLAADDSSKTMYIELREDDLLRQEWFVLILSASFSVILCAKDSQIDTTDEAQREFDAFWSFEAYAINLVLDMMEQVIADYRPEQLAAVRQARRSCPQPASDSRLITRFTLEILEQQERLNKRLRVSMQQAAQADILLRQREKLQLALDQERELSALKYSLMNTVSHEFRTPLAVILSSSELIGRYGKRLTDVDLQHRVVTIQQQIQHLRSMLDNISDIMTNQAGRTLFKPELHDFAALLHQITYEVELAFGREAHFVLRNANVSVFVHFDSHLMRQVLTNLLENALKYSPPETDINCELTVSAHEVALSIHDQGIGISAEDLPYIFQSFYRGQNVHTIGGSGLGLRIVEEYMTLHGGTVEVISVPDEGTTFTIRLPIR